MIAVLLSALFLSSGLLAAGSIAASWQRYAPALRTLRNDLAACQPLREARVRVVEVAVRSTATVLPLKPSGNLPAHSLQPTAVAA